MQQYQALGALGAHFYPKRPAMGQPLFGTLKTPSQNAPPKQMSPSVASIVAEDPQTVKIFGKTKKPTLQSFLDTMLSTSQQGKMNWTSIGTNMESTIGGFPVRLAETYVSTTSTQFKLQVFPKGLFSSFRSPLYNIDVLSSDPMGQQVSQIHALALQSMPELYDSDSSPNKGLRLFDIGRSRLALIFHKDRQQAKDQAGQDGVLFFLKPKAYYYGFKEVQAANTEELSSNTAASQQLTPSGNLQPVLPEGYITEQGYTALTHRDSRGQVLKQGLSPEQFQAALTKAGITLQHILAKAKKLLQPSR